MIQAIKNIIYREKNKQIEQLTMLTKVCHEQLREYKISTKTIKVLKKSIGHLNVLSEKHVGKKRNAHKWVGQLEQELRSVLKPYSN